MIVPVSDVKDVKEEAREIIGQTMKELFAEGENKVMNRAEAVKFLNRLCMKPRYPYIDRRFDLREDVFADEGVAGFTADYFEEHSAFIWEDLQQKKVS